LRELGSWELASFSAADSGAPEARSGVHLGMRRVTGGVLFSPERIWVRAFFVLSWLQALEWQVDRGFVWADQSLIVVSPPPQNICRHCMPRKGILEGRRSETIFRRGCALGDLRFAVGF
jgi:hypothetical protein